MMSSNLQLSVGVLALTMIYATTPVFEGEKAAIDEMIASNVSTSSPLPIVGSNAISTPLQVDKIATYPLLPKTPKPRWPPQIP